MWNIVIQLVIMLILAALQKTKKPDTAKLEDLSVPEVSETKSIAFGYGTFKMKSPNLIWYGNLSHKDIKERSLFKKITVGYKYYLTTVYSFGFGQNKLLKIYMDDKVIWSGDTTGNFTGSYDNSDFFASKNGISASFDFYSGSQIVDNDHLVNQNNLSISPMKDISYIVFRSETNSENTISFNPDGSYSNSISVNARGAYVGNALAIKPTSYLLKRIPYYPELGQELADINGDCNPAFIIYDILKNEEFGIGLKTESIDIESIKSCAQVLFDEGFGLSLVSEDQFSCRDFVNEICRHISANFIEDEKTGLVKLKLIRNDYNLIDIKTLNESNIVSFDSFSRTTNEDLYNEVKINYTNSENNYRESTAIYYNLGLEIQRANSKQSTTLSFPFCSNFNLASKIAKREAAPLTTNLSTVQIKTIRIEDLEVGDVFKLNFEDYGINNIVYRIQKINRGNINSNAMTINAIQDHFALNQSSYSDSEINKFVEIDLNATAESFKIYEVPRFLNSTYNSVACLSYANDNANKSYEFMISENNTDNYITRASNSFSDIILINMIIDEFTTSIKIKKSDDYEILDANESEMLQGANLYLLDDGQNQEYISTSGVELIGSDYYLKDVKRGCLDTVPKKFGINTLVIESESLSITSSVELSTNEKFDSKLITISDNGALSLSLAPVLTYTMSSEERYLKPIAPANLKANGEYVFNNINLSISEELNLSWSFRNLFNQDKVKSYFENDELTNTDNNYNIKIFDDLDVLIKEIDTFDNFYNFDDETTVNPLLTYYNFLRVEVRTTKSGYSSLDDYNFTITRS